MRVLGLAFSGHGTSICLVEDGRVARALNLERITRRKFSNVALPEYVDFLQDVTVRLYKGEPQPYFDFYEVFPSMLEYVTGTRSLLEAKLDLVVKTRDNIGPTDFGPDSPISEAYQRFLAQFAGVRVELDIEHHLAHSYQAFLSSPFPEAAVLTVDGSGESLSRLDGDCVSTTFSTGRERRVEVIDEICFPHSIGGIYSTVTRHLGFKHDQEGNTMALAAYGGNRFYDLIRRYWFMHKDGTYRFEFGASGHTLKMLDVMEEWIPQRRPGEELTDAHKDLAHAVQRIAEELVVNAARGLQKRTFQKHLAMAGGVSLNCVANAKILEGTDFQEIYVMPNAGDRGLAAGCALYGYHVILGGREHHPLDREDLGRAYDNDEIAAAIAATPGIRSRRAEDVAAEAAAALAAGKIIGWVQGGAEFGPRALGHRSILADPRTQESKRRLDEEIKRREWFRPYAPSVLFERVDEYFLRATASPYMLLAFQVRPEQAARIPGVVHADGSARVQTVHREREPLYHRLISEFARRTDIPMVLNTSFNLNGAPIVETPRDAIDALLEMHLDALAIGDYLVWREDRPAP